MLYLKKSLIPGAGKGLFVKNELKRGEIVCEYEGEIVPWSVCEKRAEEGHEGYAFFITKNSLMHRKSVFSSSTTAIDLKSSIFKESLVWRWLREQSMTGGVTLYS